MGWWCSSGSVQRGGCHLKPFDALYFLGKNRRRSIAVITVFSCVFLAYLGAAYISPSMDISVRNAEAQSDFCVIDFEESMQDSENIMRIQESLGMIPEVSEVIPCNPYRALNYRTNMGMRMSTHIMTLSSTEDFERLNQTLELSVAMPKNREIVMSDILLQNLGYQVGDILRADSEEAVNFNASGDVRIVGTFPSDAFTAYVVDSADNMSALLATRRIEQLETSAIGTVSEQVHRDGRGEFYRAMREFEAGYDGIEISIPDETLEEYRAMFSNFRMVYGLIDLVIAGVLSLTAVATISGMYEKRNYEFSVYKAIGFSRKEVMMKVASEILMLNVAAILLGSTLVFCAIYFLNRLAFTSIGMPIPYLHSFGVWITIAANAMVVIPALLYQLVKVNKLDISEY